MAKPKMLTIADLLKAKHEWREVAPGRVEKKMSVRSDFGSYEEFGVLDLTKEAIESGWTDVRWEISTESDYGGGEYAVMTMSGWAEATPEMIDAALAERNHKALAALEQDRRTLESLKSRRADLFR